MAQDLAIRGASEAPKREPSASRDRLVDAARELFLERGYAGVTVSAIARRAGFTTGALYANFESKEELLSAAIAGSIHELIREQLEQALPGRAPAEAAHTLLVNVMSRPVEPRDALLMHGLAAARGAEGAAVLRPPLAHMVEVVRDLLERGRADGVIDPDIDADAFLRLVAALMFGSVALNMLDLEAPDRDALSKVVRRFEAVFAPPASED